MTLQHKGRMTNEAQNVVIRGIDKAQIRNRYGIEAA
jgi:hypothetical protein